MGTRHWGKWGVVFALTITFLIIGLWHGAKWTFVIFGALHGGALILEFLTSRIRKRISNLIPIFIYDGLGILFTFAFWSLSLVFFRANNCSDSYYILSHIFTGLGSFVSHVLHPNVLKNAAASPIWSGFLFAFMMFVLMETFQRAQRSKPVNSAIFFTFQRYIGYVIFVFILFFGKYTSQSFIYFQF